MTNNKQKRIEEIVEELYEVYREYDSTANYAKWEKETSQIITQAITKSLQEQKKEMRKECKKELKKYVEALIWCSGSDDFQVGGKARRGWEKICQPLLKP